MSTLQIYAWLWTVCFLWSVGTLFAWATNDEVLGKVKLNHPWKSNMTMAVLVAAGCSLFLILGLYCVWMISDGGKFGWGLRLPVK